MHQTRNNATIFATPKEIKALGDITWESILTEGIHNIDSIDKEIEIVPTEFVATFRATIDPVAKKKFENWCVSHGRTMRVMTRKILINYFYKK